MELILGNRRSKIMSRAVKLQKAVKEFKSANLTWGELLPSNTLYYIMVGLCGRFVGKTPPSGRDSQWFASISRRMFIS